MTSNLRKAHKLIWLLLVIIVPIALIFSVLGITASTLTDADLSKQINSVQQESILDNDYMFIGLNKQEIPYSLQIILKKSLSSPAPVAYAILSGSNEASFLSALNKNGIYTFPINKSVKSIRIYDELKKVELLIVELPWD